MLFAGLQKGRSTYNNTHVIRYGGKMEWRRSNYDHAIKTKSFACGPGLRQPWIHLSPSTVCPTNQRGLMRPRLDSLPCSHRSMITRAHADKSHGLVNACFISLKVSLVIFSNRTALRKWDFVWLSGYFRPTRCLWSFWVKQLRCLWAWLDRITTLEAIELVSDIINQHCVCGEVGM